MTILSIVIIGIAAGIFISLLYPKGSKNSFGETLFLSVGGALIGGIIANFLYGLGNTGFSILSFFTLSMATIVFLFMGRLMSNE